MAENAKLLVLDKGQVVQEYQITKPETLIGREPGNDLVIVSPQVSRRHALIRQTGDGWWVENLSQSNPAQFNGQSVVAPTRLYDGAQIGLGLTVSVVLVAPPVQPQPNVGQYGQVGYTPPNYGQSPQNMPPAAYTPQNMPTSGYPPPTAYSHPIPQGTGGYAPDGGYGQPPTVYQPGAGQPAAPDYEGGATALFTSLDPFLTVTYEGITKDYQLNAPRLAIGRAHENEIVVPIKTVSRVHAVLNRTSNGYTLTDERSTNGLLYKGNKVPEITLQDGDVVRIGDELGNVANLTYHDPQRPSNNQAQSLRLDPQLNVITIGRAADNALVLRYPQVSTHHAIIRRQGQVAYLEDLGSTNGTFIRGQRVFRGTPVEVKPGEAIQIAGYQLVYQQESLAQLDADNVRIDAIGVRKVVSDGQLVLLNDISLSIAPKEFVAIVGGSGAGKSTLMDALNGFRPAPTGRVLINGDDYYQNFALYRSSLGYVPQDDIIHRELSVERALYYVAKLRLPKDTSDQEIEQRVAEVLEDVEMTARRKVEVARLSGGQRKRVSIAVELLAKPNLFFLDEPTSGLDPGLDKKMMFLLRRLADQGRTIVLVTHATSNIMACDKVVFLAPGGRLCFFGPPQDALTFFEVTEFADIYSKLEQTAQSGEEWEARYRQSPFYQQYVNDRLNHLPPPANGGPNPAPAPGFGAADSASPGLINTKAPRTSGWRQFRILSRRYAELVRQDRINLLVLLLQAPIIGIILALVAGGGLFDDGQSPAAAQKVLFMLSVAAVWLGTSNAAREITKEGPIYLRERLVNLRVFPYIMSKVAVLTVLCIVQSLLLGGIVLLRTGVPGSGAILPAFLEIIIGVWLTTMVGLAMGLLVSSLSSNTDKATSIVPILLVPQIILAGLIFPLTGPGQVLSYITVTKWSIDSLGTSSNLNKLYYQALSSAPPGIKPASLPAVQTYDPANYDDNPSDKKYLPGEVHDTRALHLLGRWGIMLFMIILLLGLTYFFQRRKDRAWTRR